LFGRFEEVKVGLVLDQHGLFGKGRVLGKIVRQGGESRVSTLELDQQFEPIVGRSNKDPRHRDQKQKDQARVNQVFHDVERLGYDFKDHPDLQNHDEKHEPRHEYKLKQFFVVNLFHHKRHFWGFFFQTKTQNKKSKKK
jgi:hypothetical protein